MEVDTRKEFRYDLIVLALFQEPGRKCQSWNAFQHYKAGFAFTKMTQLVKELKELKVIATEDARLAKENGIDLNQFSTQGARNLWQQGWDGVRPANLTDGSINWRHWERGGQARSIAREAENGGASKL